MDHHTIATQISTAKRIRNIIIAIRQRYDSHPQRYTIRHNCITRTRKLLGAIDQTTFPKVHAECLAALQKYYDDDQRHWSEWDTPWQQGHVVSKPNTEDLIGAATTKLHSIEQQTLTTTGTERHKLIAQLREVKHAICEAGYISLMPDQFIEYPDGQRLGYNELRYLLSIFENKDPLANRDPYPTKELNRLFHTANAERVGPEQDEVWDDDREYTPPTFTPALEVGWDNIEKLTLDKAHLVEECAEHALEGNAKGMSETISYLFVGSYLSEAERYFTLRTIASKTMDLAQAQGKRIGFWLTVDRLSTQAGLDQFVDENADELLDRDPGDRGIILSEQDIRDITERLTEEVFQAPIVSIHIPALEQLWRTAKHKFPAQEKIISWRSNGKVHFRLKDETDYQSLKKLYEIGGVQLTDPKLIHGHTPFYQRGVIERIASGMSIPTAYAKTRQAYLKYRRNT